MATKFLLNFYLQNILYSQSSSKDIQKPIESEYE
jgi:hypothetical protein